LDELIDRAERDLLKILDVDINLWEETNKRYQPKDHKQLDLLYKALAEKFRYFSSNNFNMKGPQFLGQRNCPQKISIKS